MNHPHKGVDLFSFNSTSKGFLGECGIRGGFAEFYNIHPDSLAQLQKTKTIYLCSNTTGQILTDLMVNPPNEKENSPEVYKQYQTEKANILASLKRRAEIVTSYLNKMKNIKTNEVEGSMYAFPSLFLSPKAIKAAKDKNMSPDLFYTMEVLDKTGIVLVPGSGFKQKEGTYHFRITTLILPEERLKKKMEDFHNFNESFHQKYE